MILDSSFLIDFLRNEHAAIEKMSELISSSEPVLTTSVTAFELRRGVMDNDEQNMLDLIESITVIPFDTQSALEAGDIHRALLKRGEIIEPEDCMIAGIALARNQPVLTRNVEHFKRVPGLKAETY